MGLAQPLSMSNTKPVSNDIRDCTAHGTVSANTRPPRRRAKSDAGEAHLHGLHLPAG